jgi:hypothetical protein
MNYPPLKETNLDIKHATTDTSAREFKHMLCPVKLRVNTNLPKYFKISKQNATSFLHQTIQIYVYRSDEWLSTENHHQTSS